MISALTGRVSQLAPPTLVLEVGGVGFGVMVTESHARTLHRGDQVTVETILIVREDSLTLYGFADSGQKSLFESLTGVTGVGPKLALAILDELTPAQISQAVLDEDDRPFRSVSGIGPKTAKLITVSLAGRIDPLVETQPVAGSDAAADAVVEALVGLGWSQDDARRAVAAAVTGDAVPTPAQLLRDALMLLGKGETRV